MGRFQAVIFDLDGVLVDTSDLHYKAWKRLADELGIPFDRKKNERLRGVPRRHSLEIILEDAPRDSLDLDALADRKNAYYVEMIMKLTPGDLLPGVMVLLDTLRERGTKIGVGSSSKNARTVIARLEIESRLDAVVDGYDYEHPKPSPDLFLRCAQRLQIDPSRCIVVEDAQVGIDAAKAGGMLAIGVGVSERLKGADRIVARASDFPLSLLD